MKRLLAVLIAVALGTVLMACDPYPTPGPDESMHHVCPGEADETPMGALPPAKPMLCDMLNPGSMTADAVGAGGIATTWSDNFEHTQHMATLPANYAQGHVGPGGTSKHFLHNNHWMADIRSDSGQYPTLLAAWMRPVLPFVPKANGEVVIEFEVATPIAGTRDNDSISDSWPEVTISTAAAPSGVQSWGSPFLRNGTYFYEAFPTANTMGCRMQQSRQIICAYDPAGSDGAGAPDRQWEINQNGTDVVPGSEVGGGPAPASLWAGCTSADDPDTICRNKFRLTLTASTLKFEVQKPGAAGYTEFYRSTPCNDRNGCETGQMGDIINNPGGFYVYFADFAYRIENDEVIRFHWDHLAVNP